MKYGENHIIVLVCVCVWCVSHHRGLPPHHQGDWLWSWLYPVWTRTKLSSRWSYGGRKKKRNIMMELWRYPVHTRSQRSHKELKFLTCWKQKLIFEYLNGSDTVKISRNSFVTVNRIKDTNGASAASSFLTFSSWFFLRMSWRFQTAFFLLLQELRSDIELFSRQNSDLLLMFCLDCIRHWSSLNFYNWWDHFGCSTTADQQVMR